MKSAFADILLTVGDFMRPSYSLSNLRMASLMETLERIAQVLVDSGFATDAQLDHARQVSQRDDIGLLDAFVATGITLRHTGVATKHILNLILSRLDFTDALCLTLSQSEY